VVPAAAAQIMVHGGGVGGGVGSGGSQRMEVRFCNDETLSSKDLFQYIFQSTPRSPKSFSDFLFFFFSSSSLSLSLFQFSSPLKFI
jgi:hypothetical protein